MTDFWVGNSLVGATRGLRSYLQTFGGNEAMIFAAQRSRAMPEYETRTTSMTIVPKGEPLFSEQATQVTTVDEAGGEFVEVCQSGSIGLGKIAINPEEWPALRDAISLMIENCREQTE